jgi:hypothetical protein
MRDRPTSYEQQILAVFEKEQGPVTVRFAVSTIALGPFRLVRDSGRHMPGSDDEWGFTQGSG